MKNKVAIRREDLSKKGEKRVAIIPQLAKILVEQGVPLTVQPRQHPKTGEVKRAFEDSAYQKVGATISEDISEAKVVFGLKEIAIDEIRQNTAYLCFSHTHKGQVKNQKMLQVFKDRLTTLMDYELMVNDKGARVITAFTYYAGYAGMVDTIWAVGQRYKKAGISHPFSTIPQSIETEDLGLIKNMLKEIGEDIKKEGTPAELPPFINLILGQGKTSTGAQEIYDILPVEEISLADLPRVFESGDRKKVYKCVLGITEMFRLKANASISAAAYAALSTRDKEGHYFVHPDDFESNLEVSLPYATILMNCILWGPEFPRTMSKDFTATQWANPIAIGSQTLMAIGDITCDPNGSIEFSRETWIDNPVYMYNPATRESVNGFDGDGIAVMAVTNLPCEFSPDASAEFSQNLSPYALAICEANFDGTLEESGLPVDIKRSVILWKGEFTEEYAYMG
jgi:alpha-aminoadipic semialdehyde synthase